MTKKILIVEDDPEIRDFIRLYLTNEGYEVAEAERGDMALAVFEREKPDLILLDVILPGMDGIEICREIRKTSIVPIIFISTKAEEFDKVIGLTIGADDYMTKPFSPRELTARIKSLLRRQQYYASEEKQPVNILRFPDLEIDLYRHTVTRGGEKIELSSKEFKLLSYMAHHPGRVFTVEELFEMVWEESSLGDTRTVMVHISSLRKKIEQDQAKPKYIITIRGSGYKFAEI